jgi:hypothetical protein
MLRTLPLLLLAIASVPVTAQVTRDNTSVTYGGGPPPDNLRGRLESTDPLFNRPTATGQGLSGTLVPYDTVRFTYSGRAVAMLSVRYGMDGNPEASCSNDDDDTFLAVYRNTFSAAAPLRNLIAVRDNADADDYCSTLRNLPVAAGETVILVLTTFLSQQRGTSVFMNYEISFEGTGDDLIFADGFAAD